MHTHNSFLLYHVLKSFHGYDTRGYSEDGHDSSNLKNVCAKLHPYLVDRIDSAIGLLGISKTQFIEAAAVQFLDNLGEVLKEYGHADVKTLEAQK